MKDDDDGRKKGGKEIEWNLRELSRIASRENFPVCSTFFFVKKRKLKLQQIKFIVVEVVWS